MADIKDSPTDEVAEIQDSSMNNFNAETGLETGMYFSSLDKLFQAYQEHAKSKGFSVAEREGHKGHDGERNYQIISCGKGKKSDAKRKIKKRSYPTRLNAVRKEGG